MIENLAELPMPDPRLSEIVEACLQLAHVSRGELFSDSRAARIVLARQLFAGAARRLNRASLPELAAFIGRRHSTINSAARRFEIWPQEVIDDWMIRIDRQIQFNRSMRKAAVNPDREAIEYWCASIANMRKQVHGRGAWARAARAMAEVFEHSAARRIA